MTIRRKVYRDLTKEVSEQIAKTKNAFIIKLFAIGEKCTNDARLNGSYTDRTGNLRGSTGYVVVDDGKIVTVGGFQQVKDGSEGPMEGKGYALELAASVGSGSVALIVVAGRNYAAYVERRGYNVLASAEILAEKLIQELLAKMGK